MGDTGSGFSERKVQMDTMDSGMQTLRITSHGKMKAWIAKSLTFLEASLAKLRELPFIDSNF